MLQVCLRKVGDVASHGIYGKWEDYALKRLPLLDACGAHIGPTPDSSTPVYHYHVQDTAPFTVGCHGPSQSGGLVSVAVCRSLYSDCDNDGGSGTTLTTKTGNVQYDRFCPCFDAAGSNMGTNVQELPALSTSDIYYVEGTSASGTTASTTSTKATTTTTTTSTTSTTAGDTTVGDTTAGGSSTSVAGGTTASGTSVAQSSASTSATASVTASVTASTTANEASSSMGLRTTSNFLADNPDTPKITTSEAMETAGGISLKLAILVAFGIFGPLLEA